MLAYVRAATRILYRNTDARMLFGRHSIGAVLTSTFLVCHEAGGLSMSQIRPNVSLGPMGGHQFKILIPRMSSFGMREPKIERR